MSFSRFQLRRVATFVLLGWVLALGVSVAHACGLVSGLADGGHGVDASCVKFCDESKNSAPGAGTIAASAPADLNSFPLLLLQPDRSILPLRAAWMRDQRRRPPREVAIELLRLTL